MTKVRPLRLTFDTEVGAAYLHVRKAKIHRTVERMNKKGFATIDLDSEGEVIGIEVVGWKSFDLQEIAKIAGIRPSKVDWSKLQIKLL